MVNKLILGNNEHIIKEWKEKIIDCTITSPPYNKGENKNSGQITKAVIYDSLIDSIPEDHYQNNQVIILNLIHDITKDGGHCFYNHKVRYIDGNAISPFAWLSKTKWTIRQEIVWDRIIASNIRGWRFWNVDERIYWLYKPKHLNDRGEELNSHFAKMTSIWRFKPEGGVKEHPAPFPIELPTNIIKSLYTENSHKLIFDPYVGSGTTSIAAKALGHDYLGIDISMDYIKLAEKRLSETSYEDCRLSTLFGE